MSESLWWNKQMKRWLILSLLILLLGYGIADAQTAHIPDLHLLTVIERSLGKVQGQVISVADMQTLTVLHANDFSITHLTGLEHATNLTELNLSDNKIRDISTIAHLTQLNNLDLGGNRVEDISALGNLTHFTRLILYNNRIKDITPLGELTQLGGLNIAGNDFADISVLSNLTGLTWLNAGGNNISDITVLATLSRLDWLYIGRNKITDIKPLANLTELVELHLAGNKIIDISPLANLTKLEELFLNSNRITDVSPLVNLRNLKQLDIRFNSSQDTSPLCLLQIQNPDLIVDIELTCAEYELSLSAGINLIHIPLKVVTVNGAAQTIESISDVYDALGGAGAVNFLITYDSKNQEWRSYFGTSDADTMLADETGILAGMNTPVSVRLNGTALGQNGYSTFTLRPGLNLVGLPLRDPRINRVSDLFTVGGIENNVPVIILADGGEFTAVGRAGDPGDIPITGGQAFILTAQHTYLVTFSGPGWE